jgi:hypothetical protein
MTAQPPTAAPEKPLPPGPMQAKIKAACTQCHNTARISEQHLTRQQWSDQLDKMEGLGAVIPEGDRDAMLAYLFQNFGPAKGAGKTAAKKPTGN